jgi:hypothetical protein
MGGGHRSPGRVIQSRIVVLPRTDDFFARREHVNTIAVARTDSVAFVPLNVILVGSSDDDGFGNARWRGVIRLGSVEIGVVIPGRDDDCDAVSNQILHCLINGGHRPISDEAEVRNCGFAGLMVVDDPVDSFD